MRNRWNTIKCCIHKRLSSNLICIIDDIHGQEYAGNRKEQQLYFVKILNIKIFKHLITIVSIKSNSAIFK